MLKTPNALHCDFHGGLCLGLNCKYNNLWLRHRLKIPTIYEIKAHLLVFIAQKNQKPS